MSLTQKKAHKKQILHIIQTTGFAEQQEVKFIC